MGEVMALGVALHLHFLHVYHLRFLLLAQWGSAEVVELIIQTPHPQPSLRAGFPKEIRLLPTLISVFAHCLSGRDRDEG